MATSSKITERIGKRLSRNGICSRREAERWISQGRISVDGIPITSPNILVNEKTIIFVDGKKINTSRDNKKNNKNLVTIKNLYDNFLL